MSKLSLQYASISFIETGSLSQTPSQFAPEKGLSCLCLPFQAEIKGKLPNLLDW